VLGRVPVEPRRVDDRELRRVVLPARRVALGDEHVPREETVPSLLGDDADRQTVGGVGAA